MKYTLFFLFICFSSFCQSRIIYEYKITDDSKGFYNIEDMILYSDYKQSIFASLKGVLNVKDLQNQRRLGTAINVNITDFSKVFSKFYHEYKQQEMIYLEFLHGVNVKTKIMSIANWQLADETKLINNKKVRKAVVNLYDREWIAWYDVSIPLQEGPYMFKGLPGLIVELYDEDKHHYFILKGESEVNISLEDLGLKEFKHYREVSLNSLKSLSIKALANPYEFRKANSNLKPVDMSAERQKTFNSERKREYQSILFKDL